jgi:hypothetical protein
VGRAAAAAAAAAEVVAADEEEEEEEEEEQQQQQQQQHLFSVSFQSVSFMSPTLTPLISVMSDAFSADGASAKRICARPRSHMSP